MTARKEKPMPFDPKTAAVVVTGAALINFRYIASGVATTDEVLADLS